MGSYVSWERSELEKILREAPTADTIESCETMPVFRSSPELFSAVRISISLRALSACLLACRLHSMCAIPSSPHSILVYSLSPSPLLASFRVQVLEHLGLAANPSGIAAAGAGMKTFVKSFQTGANALTATLQRK